MHWLKSRTDLKFYGYIESMKFLKKIFITYLIASAIFLGGMIGVYTLDSPSIHKNVQEALVALNDEGPYPAIGNFGGWILDNKTDAIMIREAANVYSQSPLQDALLNKCNIDFKPETSTINLPTENSSADFYVYGRYWHGYMTTLKPLLMLFNYSEIRIINAFVLLLGLFISFLGVMKQCTKGISFLYLGVMLVAITPPVFISLQYTSCFLLTFIFIGLLTFYPSLTSNVYRGRIYFFVIGMITVFFDFLTVPIITLCFPLTIYCLMKRDLNCYRNILLLIIFWFLGYGGLWMTKWLLATSITDQNIFIDALKNIFIRTYGQEITMTYSKWIGIAYYVSLFAYTFIIWKSRRKKPFLYKYFNFLIIALLPAVWLVVLRGHTLLHYWFTYRAFYASFFALIIYIIKIAHARNSNSYTLS